MGDSLNLSPVSAHIISVPSWRSEGSETSLEGVGVGGAGVGVGSANAVIGFNIIY